MPFGFGPCSCIGMRFALLEANIALIELLKRYTFVRAPDTEVATEFIHQHDIPAINYIYVCVTDYHNIGLIAYYALC